MEMPEAGKKISPNILCLHRLFGPSYQPTTAFEGDVICSEACRTKVGHKLDTLDRFVDHICRFGAPEGSAKQSPRSLVVTPSTHPTALREHLHHGRSARSEPVA